jgi:hypothetical protein
MNVMELPRIPTKDRVELLRITRRGELWEVQAAVNGVPYPPFWEPVARTWDWPEDEFFIHLREQAISMADYCTEKEKAG